MTESADAEEFGEILRRFLGERVDLPTDEPDDDVTTHDPELWRELAVDLGVGGLLVPAHLGGSGAPFHVGARACLEAGRALLGEPIASTLLASVVLSSAPSSDRVDEVLSAIASGSAVAVAGADRDRRPTGVVASPPRGGSCRLNETASFVVSARDCEFVLVEAQSAVGPVIACAPTSLVDIRNRTSIDRTRSIADVTFDDTEAVVVADGAAAANLASHSFALGALLTALDAIGGADRIFATTVDYVRDRYQFGRSVGSFQAVKHRCAETAVDLELCHATIDDAVDAVATERPDRVAAIATAALLTKEAFVKATHDAVLSLGGIGFTWEHPAHRFFRRARLDLSLYGEPAWWSRRLAAEFDGLGSAPKQAMKEAS